MVPSMANASKWVHGGLVNNKGFDLSFAHTVDEGLCISSHNTWNELGLAIEPFQSKVYCPQRLNFLLHIFRPFNTLPDLPFILDTRLAGKGLVQAGLKVFVA